MRARLERAQRKLCKPRGRRLRYAISAASECNLRDADYSTNNLRRADERVVARVHREQRHPHLPCGDFEAIAWQALLTRDLYRWLQGDLGARSRVGGWACSQRSTPRGRRTHGAGRSPPLRSRAPEIGRACSLRSNPRGRRIRGSDRSLRHRSLESATKRRLSVRDLVAISSRSRRDRARRVGSANRGVISAGAGEQRARRSVADAQVCLRAPALEVTARIRRARRGTGVASIP